MIGHVEFFFKHFVNLVNPNRFYICSFFYFHLCKYILGSKDGSLRINKRLDYTRYTVNNHFGCILFCIYFIKVLFILPCLLDIICYSSNAHVVFFCNIFKHKFENDSLMTYGNNFVGFWRLTITLTPCSYCLISNPIVNLLRVYDIFVKIASLHLSSKCIHLVNKIVLIYVLFAYW